MPNRPPLTDIGQFEFWPALILVANTEDLRKMRTVVEHYRKRQPYLAPVEIEVAHVLVGLRPGEARMYRTIAEVPPILRSGVVVRD